jgi:hypothetical protein
LKVILSRKGFDSSCGGAASPIYEDRLYSLPIPEPVRSAQTVRYGDIPADDHTLGEFVRDLTRGRMPASDFAHLDPDLRPEARPRGASWRPIFGQAGAAEAHLQSHGVGPGDLFVFYGWFRRVERRDGRFHYVQGSPDLHVIWGWLQIEKRITSTDSARLPDWSAGHPHYMRELSRCSPDSLYVTSDRLRLPGIEHLCVPGAGVFAQYRDSLCLTDTSAPTLLRTRWRLPRWLHPDGKRDALTYHGDMRRWQTDGEHALLRSAARGQEFVLDCDDYSEALEWVSGLFADTWSRTAV